MLNARSFSLAATRVEGGDSLGAWQIPLAKRGIFFFSLPVCNYP